MKKRPWLDENGKPYTDSELKLKSKSWSLEDWELFQNEGMEDELERFERVLNGSRDMDQLFTTEDRIWDYIGSSLGIRCSDEFLTKFKDEMRNLKSEDRKILDFFFNKNMPDHEIASAIGKSQSAIKMRRMRALKKLREAFSHTDFKKCIRGKQPIDFA